MAMTGSHKLSDAIRQLWRKADGGKGSEHVPSCKTTSDQKCREAGNAGASTHERILDIGVVISKPVDRVNEGPSRRFILSWDQIAGQWKQRTGKMKERWGKLIDSERTIVAGKRDQLAGLLQQRYGYARDQAGKKNSTSSRNR